MFFGEVHLGHSGVFLAVDHYSLPEVSLEAGLNAVLWLTSAVISCYVFCCVEFLDAHVVLRLKLGIDLIL